MVSKMMVPLIVSYENKDVVKQCGARWKPDAKFWYADNIRTAKDLINFVADPYQAEVVNDIEEQIWLNVPFERKDYAKANGAKWDMAGRSWYAPDEATAEALREFIWNPRVIELPE